MLRRVGRKFAAGAFAEWRKRRPQPARAAVTYGHFENKESLMSRRSSRHNLLALSINLGLVAGIGMFGCGEARPSTDLLSTGEIPNGVVGTLHARIASYDDGHAETFYRLVRDDGEEISL